MINKMNKKGQIGKIITSFPIMLMIFLLMAIYLVIIGIGSIDRPTAFSSFSGVRDSVLLEKVVVQGEEVTILDGFVNIRKLADNGKTDDAVKYLEDLMKAIDDKLKRESVGGEKAKCMIINYDIVTTDVKGNPEERAVFMNGKSQWNYDVDTKVYAIDNGAYMDKFVWIIFTNWDSEGVKNINLEFQQGISFGPTGEGILKPHIGYYYGDCVMQDVIK